jgi:Cys-tRNA(Pro)/Cys-tRNA(Cys) deacylase
MAKKQDRKSNAVRELERTGAAFSFHTFEGAEGLSGVEVARLRGDDPDRVFKTLVTVGHSGQHFVFMIPVAEELDLKKAAQAVGEKSVHMIPARELLPLTGYVHGGCSPLGMKKLFPTAIDETAELFDTILFSGGRIGAQIETSLDALERCIPLQIADLTAR